MTPKQQRFVDEYPIDCNAQQAAVRAGYSPRNAKRIALEIMRREDVRAALAVKQAEIAERNNVTVDEVIGYLRENIHRGLQAIPCKDRNGNPTGIYRWDGAVVNKAAELLGRSIGMFTDKIDHSGTVRHEHYDAKVPLTEDERRNRIAALLSAYRN